MQVLLNIQQTIFKLDDTVAEHSKMMQYIKSHFVFTQIKENVFYLPSSHDKLKERSVLLKWLYIEYKKSAKNFKKELKSELIKRIDKPIHLYFASTQKRSTNIVATFYENNICQLAVEKKCEISQNYILKQFTGHISLKSKTFNLYDVQVDTAKHRKTLSDFFQTKSIATVQLNILYNKAALHSFLQMSESLDKIDKACMILKVSKNDSLKEIKKNYKRLAKSYHPDRANVNLSASTEKFQLLQKAFETIIKYKEVA